VGFDTPEDLLYTDEHEWVRVEDGLARVGITDFAQDQLTDVVFVELPGKGETYQAGDAFAVLESVKSVSDVYAPVDGTVAEVNTELEASPEVVNEDPYGDGWLAAFEMDDPDQVDGLMDADAYVDHTEA
jgi:glycine cleavage system H protein